MWTAGGCLTVIVLGVIGLVITVAFQAAWQHRLEPPLTTTRLVLLVTLTIGAAAAVVSARADWLLIPLIVCALVVSVGWLIIKGL